MSNWQIYFQLGFHHIMNWGALDHILFIAALALRYQFADWKKLLILVTAFTIGHTITLTLSVFDVVSISKIWTEFLISVTIIITACSNLFVKKFNHTARFPAIYFFALFFGLIHGLGFSNDLKSLIDNDKYVVVKLLSANIGIEAAQLIFVLMVLVISVICTNIIRMNRREYVLFVSGGIFGMALQMAIARWPF
jgi:hypothetical protein